MEQNLYWIQFFLTTVITSEDKMSHRKLNNQFYKRRCSWKFRKTSEENTCSRDIFNKVSGPACNLNKKETLVQVFSCEFCETFKNTFCTFGWLFWQGQLKTRNQDQICLELKSSSAVLQRYEKEWSNILRKKCTAPIS